MAYKIKETHIICFENIKFQNYMNSCFSTNNNYVQYPIFVFILLNYNNMNILYPHLNKWMICLFCIRLSINILHMDRIILLCNIDTNYLLIKILINYGMSSYDY